MGMRRTWFVVAGMLLAAALPALAGDGGRNTIRLGAGYMVPTENASATYDQFDYETLRFDTEFKAGYGASLAYEFKATPKLGIELGVAYYQTDLGLKVYGIETGPPPEAAADDAILLDDWTEQVNVMPVTLGVNFHFGDGKVDWYAGPELAYVVYDDFEKSLGNLRQPGYGVFRAEFEDELTWGLKLGVAAPLGGRWLFGAQIEYLDARAKVDRTLVDYGGIDAREVAEEQELPYLKGEKLDPLPVVFNVGVAYRF